MKDACFPKFAFRFDITKDKQPIEYFLESKGINLPVYDCHRRRIQRMNSFTQKYVDRYVRKFSF